MVRKRSLGWSEAAAERRNLIAAHRRSYELIHQIDPAAMVSSNIVWTGDTTIGRIAQGLTAWAFLDAVKDRIDYLAFDFCPQGTYSAPAAGMRTGCRIRRDCIAPCASWRASFPPSPC